LQATEAAEEIKDLRAQLELQAAEATAEIEGIKSEFEKMRAEAEASKLEAEDLKAEAAEAAELRERLNTPEDTQVNTLRAQLQDAELKLRQDEANACQADGKWFFEVSNLQDQVSAAEKLHLAADEIEKLHAELSAAKLQASQASEAESKLLAEVHNLRTELSAAESRVSQVEAHGSTAPAKELNGVNGHHLNGHVRTVLIPDEDETLRLELQKETQLATQLSEQVAELEGEIAALKSASIAKDGEVNWEDIPFLPDEEDDPLMSFCKEFPDSAPCKTWCQEKEANGTFQEEGVGQA